MATTVARRLAVGPRAVDRALSLSEHLVGWTSASTQLLATRRSVRFNGSTLIHGPPCVGPLHFTGAGAVSTLRRWAIVTFVGLVVASSTSRLPWGFRYGIRDSPQAHLTHIAWPNIHRTDVLGIGLIRRRAKGPCGAPTAKTMRAASFGAKPALGHPRSPGAWSRQSAG